MYQEINLNSWAELRDELLKRHENWIFRGLDKYSYELKSTLERYFEEESNIPRSCIYYYEREMISQFNRSIHQYVENTGTILNSNFQKISFLQHHGAPTRLLDFTYSPFAACFFSLRKMKKDKETGDGDGDGAIVGIDGRIFKDIQDKAFAEIRKQSELYIKNTNPIDADEVKDAYTKLKTEGISISNRSVDEVIKLSWKREKLGIDQSFVGLVNPYFKFDRLTNQKGCFLIQFDMKISFEANLEKCTEQIRTDTKENLVKYRIKSVWRDEALKDLDKMNINNSSLFPGLDGFVQSLNIQADLSIRNQRDRGYIRC